MENNYSFDTIPDLVKFGKNLKPLKAVFGNYIIQNTLVHFPSERGTGKTFFMLQVCIAISGEASSFCNENIEINGNSLYINCELNRDLMARRVAKLYEQPPFKISNKYTAYVFTTRNSFASEKENIIKKIISLKPVLVVLDNWKTAFRDIDPNKNRETAIAFIELLNLKDRYGFSFVIVDHTKKGSRLLRTDSDLQSGAGSKSDLADQDFFLRKSRQSKDFRLLKRVKSRICEDQENPKLLKFNEETLWFEVEEEEVNELDHIFLESISNKDEALVIARKLKEKGISIKEITEITGIAKSTLHRKLKDLDD